MVPVKALVLGLVLAVAGAGVSGAVLTGTLPLLQTNAAADEEPLQGWEVLETFTGEAAGFDAGALDLRTFWGNIQVVGWSQEAYDITVYQRGGGGGQRLSDASVEAVFAEDRSDGLALSLQVVRSGNYDLSINEDSADFAVVANVPSSIAWSTVNVCSGSTHGFGRALHDALMPALGAVFGDEEEGEDRVCVEGNAPIDMNFGRIDLQDDSGSDEATEIPFALSNLQGGELMVHAQYADLGLESLAFEQAGVMTQYGDVLGTLDALELHVMTQYGDIGLTSVADTFEVLSQYGDLHLAVTDGGAGKYNVGTQYGDLVLGLPMAPDFGFDVGAMTQYGEALIILDGVEYGSDDEDDGAASQRDFVPGLPGFPGFPGMPGSGGEKERNHGGSEVEAQSEHFDAAAIQVEVKAWTQYGDVLVTNGEMPDEDEDDDQA